MYEREIVEIYNKCGVCCYPINTYSIMFNFGYKLIHYSDLQYKYGDKIESLERSIGDAITNLETKTVLYNDKRDIRRIRFTLMHELGHIVLKDNKDEDGADAFAAEILAPLAVIRHKHFKTAKEISDFFQLSMSASNISILRSKISPADDDHIILDYFRDLQYNNVFYDNSTLFDYFA